MKFSEAAVAAAAETNWGDVVGLSVLVVCITAVIIVAIIRNT